MPYRASAIVLARRSNTRQRNSRGAGEPRDERADSLDRDMDEAANPPNVEYLCRLCLSADEPRSSVFADRQSSVTLANKIHACLSIEILASDKLSTSICSGCLTKVNEWHAYKESCVRSQEKLRRWIAERAESIQQLPIKSEPMDFDEPAGSLETVRVTSDDEWESFADECNGSADVTICNRADRQSSLPRVNLLIKREALEVEDDESRNNTENESTCSAELLPNPMAVASSKEDRAIEPDSTQNHPKVPRTRKRKPRRGATHYRGARKFRQRCVFCQIHLHSKHSYTKHMERFHSAAAKPATSTRRANNLLPEESKKFLEKSSDPSEEMVEVEDVEDELVSLEKDAPLTPVQQNIISQLKTFSCYSCRQTFQDRRSTLNHIRQHMPDLRPYTCIACLTEFADRSIYKLHCGASFQCAMKIALVVPEHGTEKYFTCNMCLRPLSDRRELMSHLSKHSDKQYQQLLGAPRPPKLKPMARLAVQTEIPVPYNDGDPAHNNLCRYCGMIYKHKQNLSRHVELCEKLPENGRISYRCVHCGATFLAFSKFQKHLKDDHKKRDYVCSHCRVSFGDPGEYLQHYREHRPLELRTLGVAKTKPARWSCILCPGSGFASRARLADHRKAHLRTKIYSCPVCRRIFAGPDALEEHMVEHEQQLASENSANSTIPNPMYDEANASKISACSDPGEGSSECPTCGKVFASYHNLRRHVRNVHGSPGRYRCFSCARNFKNEREWAEHVAREHRKTEAVISCPVCAEKFESQDEMTAHRREVHRTDGEDSLSCYICGKAFLTLGSLRIHRGHHFRVNSRLSIGKIAPIEDDDDPIAVERPSLPQPVVRSPRARKSFPNSPARPAPSVLQCQVCNDRFNDVANLRKHLWDVHCARNKPEKEFPSARLQCELCTNVLPDEESLRSHMSWHESNPILFNSAAKRENPATAHAKCDECGKFYSSLGNLMKHKKRHKVTNLAALKLQRNIGAGFACQFCKKVFAMNATLKKHVASCHAGDRTAGATPAPPRTKQEFDNEVRKGVTCNLCRKILADRHELYKHRARIHKVTRNGAETHGGATATDESRVPCTVCAKSFSSATNMRQHFSKVHAHLGHQYACDFEGCQLMFKTFEARRKHRKTHPKIIYSCPVCRKRLPSKAAVAGHVTREHCGDSVGNRKNDKTAAWKRINLDEYTVKGANGRQCPLCNIVYPNYKALKIHYLKIHEGAA